MTIKEKDLGGFNFERIREIFEDLLAEQDEAKRDEIARAQVSEIQESFYANLRAKGEDQREENQRISQRVSKTLEAVAGLPDFHRIFLEFHSIPDLIHKIGYVDRIIYERLTPFAGVFLGPQTTTLFHYQLREIGLPLLCPYLNLEQANKTTGQDCTIDDKEKIMTFCDGRYDICALFKNRMERAAQGLIEIRLPKVRGLQLPQECLVNLDDLDDWWQQEGRYE